MVVDVNVLWPSYRNSGIDVAPGVWDVRDMPRWLPVIALIAAYALLALPIGAGRRAAVYYANGGRMHGGRLCRHKIVLAQRQARLKLLPVGDAERRGHPGQPARSRAQRGFVAGLIRDQAAQEPGARRSIGIARPFDLGRQGVGLSALIEPIERRRLRQQQRRERLAAAPDQFGEEFGEAAHVLEPFRLVPAAIEVATDADVIVAGDAGDVVDVIGDLGQGRGPGRSVYGRVVPFIFSISAVVLTLKIELSRPLPQAAVAAETNIGMNVTFTTPPFFAMRARMSSGTLRG
jgi:hypothetical protein